MTIGLRSLLFVPGDDARKINRALASQADAVIIDLEDSVALPNKDAARHLAGEVLQQPRKITIFVRINGLSSGQSEADLDAVLTHRPNGIVLPKCRSGDDITRLAIQTGPNVPVIAIATETASSLLAMATYASAGASLVALAWGGEDLSLDLGAATNRASDGGYADPYRLARTLCLVGARAAGVEPIDAVFTAYRDLAGLETEAEAAARDGFSGKLAIHPDQVPVINRVFTPSQKDVERAERVVAAFESAGRRGVIGLDGEMLDVPHLRRAERILARAGRSRGANGQ
jgi:citrate lyase subunit beta / citryl-CoA lyase